MIEVEVKVVGLYAGQFVTVSKTIRLKEGSGPKQALFVLYKSGVISREAFKQIRRFRPPTFLALNDVKIETGRNRFSLKDGDTLSILQLAAGG